MQTEMSNSKFFSNIPHLILIFCFMKSTLVINYIYKIVVFVLFTFILSICFYEMSSDVITHLEHAV